MSANSPVKRGVVRAVDAQRHKYRVEFEDEDGVQSFWLDGPSGGSAGKKDRPAAFRPGSQVWCLVDWRGEDGCVVQAAYSTADPTPNTVAENDHTRYEDGAIAEHDPVTHVNRLMLTGEEAKRFVEVRRDGAPPTRLLITPDGVFVNKPIEVVEIPEQPIRGRR